MKHMSHSEKYAGNTPKLATYFSSSDYSMYNELEDMRMQHSSLEDEFVSNLALVEDLHNRFRFMITELKTSGLKVDE